jgi:hypothetical protein
MGGAELSAALFETARRGCRDEHSSGDEPQHRGCDERLCRLRARNDRVVTAPWWLASTRWPPA